MTDFQFTNELYHNQIDFIINFITQELIFIKKNRKNLVNFAYSQSIKGKLIFIDFERIINETQRMSIEIEFLEEKRQHYSKTKKANY